MKYILTFFILLLNLSQTNAGTVSGGKMTITVGISTKCAAGQVNTGTDFGNYTGSANRQIQPALYISCTNGTPYSFSLSGGNGTINNRFMTANGSSDNLYYNIYTDSGFSIIFGDGTTGSNVTGTGTGSGTIIYLYGRILSGQLITPGAYSDSLNLTLTY